MGKKIKKVKKKVATKATDEATGSVPMEDFNNLRSKYLRLKKEYTDLREAFDRINVLEEDIKKVHGKLDQMDTGSDSVKKELMAVRSRVDQMQRNVEKISYLATKVSDRFLVKKKAMGGPGAQTRPGARPEAKPGANQGPVTRPAGPSKPLTRAAKALVMARTSGGPAAAKAPKKVTDEITADPGKVGKVPEPKDLKAHAERMDEADVISDEDMDSMDYLIRQEGKKVPLDKKVVKKTIEEDRDQD